MPIDYAAEEGPKLAIRVQELFGLNRHPTIASGRTPLVIELLSPAHRPVQVTRDLPNFCVQLRRRQIPEMRGRYPQPSLARRSRRSAGDATRQAARDVGRARVRRVSDLITEGTEKRALAQLWRSADPDLAVSLAIGLFGVKRGERAAVCRAQPRRTRRTILWRSAVRNA